MPSRPCDTKWAARPAGILYQDEKYKTKKHNYRYYITLERNKKRAADDEGAPLQGLSMHRTGGGRNAGKNRAKTD